MAQISEANAKTAVAAAAVQLTTLFKDTVKTEVAPSLANPHHPLRRILKLFNFNGATGVVTSDDAYITAAYDGLFPSKGNQFDKVGGQVLVLTTAAVADAEQADIVLTFDDIITSVDAVSVGGDADPAKIISSISIASNVVTIVVSVDYDNGDTITVSGNFRGNKNNSKTLAAQAVTNNVA